MPKRKLKILHAIAQRPDATGSGVYLQSIMREAAGRGHENVMICGIEAGSDVELHGVSLEQCRFVRFSGGDLSFHIPGMTDIMPYPSTRFRDLSEDEIEAYENVFSRALTETAADFQPDIVHSHHNWLVSSLARRLFPDLPVVTTCHGTDLRQFENCPHLRERVAAGCGRLDAAMVLNGDQKTRIANNLGLPPEKVVVVGAGYDDGVFSPGAKPAPSPVRIVYAGKLWNAKGLPWLLEALERIEDRDWVLHLIGGGSGPETEECMRLAGKLGERVRVCGQIPQARLAEIFKTSHVFVLPSLFEGLPLVLLEALACGCRLIATDLPGVMEVVGGCEAEFVSLVPTPRLRRMDKPYPEDLPEFARNLARALEDQIAKARRRPRIRLSEVQDRLAAFTWKGVFERVQRVYFDALSA